MIRRVAFIISGVGTLSCASMTVSAADYGQQSSGGYTFRNQNSEAPVAEQTESRFRPNDKFPQAATKTDSQGNQEIDTGGYVFRSPRQRKRAEDVATEVWPTCPTPQQPVQPAYPYGYSYGYPQVPQNTLPGGGYSSPSNTPGGAYPQWPGNGSYSTPFW